MIDPVTASLLIKGGTAIGKYAWNKWGGGKQPGFENTDYGRQLKQLSSEGAYNSRVRSNIIGGVAQQTGNVAANTKADMSGRLINSGMEGSIAGQASLNRVDNARMGQIGDVTQDVLMKNEESKQQYAQQYAQARTAYKERLNAAKTQNNQELVGGLLDAAGSYAMGKVNQNFMKKNFASMDMNDPKSQQNFIAGSQNPEQAAGLVESMAKTSYYNQGRETSAEAKSSMISEVLEKYKNSPSPDPTAMANELAIKGVDENEQDAAVNMLIQWVRNNEKSNPN